MKKIIIVLMCLYFGTAEQTWSQGPPITLDKPIMVGSESKIIKTLTEIRVTDGGTFVRAPIMLHYIFNKNYLMALHVPFINTPHGDGLGDIDLLAKYQVFRKDSQGKTIRIAAKAIQTFPTAPFIGDPDFGIGKYQTYFGFVSGYETIKHGIGVEIGYKYIDGPAPDRLNLNYGIGIPLFKPIYPAKQINLYFENKFTYFPSIGLWNIRTAQGIQYARKQWTYGVSLMIPLLQEFQDLHKHNYSIFIDTRYLF